MLKPLITALILAAVASARPSAGAALSADEDSAFKTGELRISMQDAEGLPSAPEPSPSPADEKAYLSGGADGLGALHVERSVINGGGKTFTFVHLTDLHIGESGAKEKLREAVSWINSHKDPENIAFVAVTGDITVSALMQDFRDAKAELDALDGVPYIPMPGNHDLWPYDGSGDLVPTPVGDAYFMETFAPVFDDLKRRFGADWDDGTRAARTRNLEADSNDGSPAYSYFQNFAFSYRGYHFICADFNTRKHAYPIESLGKYGTLPEADLFDFEGGTWPWFVDVYERLKGKDDRTDNIIVMTHHPFVRDVISDSPIPWETVDNVASSPAFSQIFGHLSAQDAAAAIYAFSSGEMGKLGGFLNGGGNQKRSGGWIAGHIHRDQTYNIKTSATIGAGPVGVTFGVKTICPGIETDALKNGHLRLITVGGAL